MTTHRLRCEQLFDGERFFSPGYIEIHDGVITSIGERARFDITETLTGLTLPGLPNLHSHAFQRGVAGLTEKAPRGARDASSDTFWSWRDRMYQFVERLTPDDVESLAAQAYVEMLEAGYTSVAEFHYVHHQSDGTPYEDLGELGRRVIRAARSVGMRMALLPVYYETSGFGDAPISASQRRFFCDPSRYEALYASLSGERDALISLGMAPHSLRAAPLRGLQTLVQHVRAADPRGVIHIHIAEQQREVEECLAHHGQRPVERLLDHVPVDRHWCLVHATHLSDAEATGIARSGAVVGLCPTTEANLGDGVFSLCSYLQQGGRFGVGSDSQVSIDPVQELRLLEYGQRLLSRSRNTVAEPGADEGVSHTGVALFRHALSAGAQALGAEHEKLEIGAPADLIVLDPQHPSLLAREGADAIDSWIFAANRPAITRVMVHGHFVVEGGVHVRRDSVQARFERTLRRLLA